MFLDTNFALGDWHAVVRLTTDAPYCHVRRFSVEPGGDAGGTAVALCDLVLPATHYLVWEADSATLVKGKNPYVS